MKKITPKEFNRLVRTKTTGKCPVCKKEFSFYESSQQRRVTCSQRCHKAHQRITTALFLTFKKGNHHFNKLI